MEDILTTSAPFNETNFFDRFVFGWIDYTFFILVLLVSLLIGVYFGLYTKQDTPTEYFLGGKRMKRFPIAMSVALRSVLSASCEEISGLGRVHGMSRSVQSRLFICRKKKKKFEQLLLPWLNGEFKFD